jgi:hypothetical protein
MRKNEDLLFIPPGRGKFTQQIFVPSPHPPGWFLFLRKLVNTSWQWIALTLG